jgi:Protein of unknown function (DUF3605)
MDYSIINTKEDLYRILDHIEKQNPSYNGRGIISNIKLKLYHLFFKNNIKTKLAKKLKNSRNNLFSITINDFPYSKLINKHQIKQYIVWNIFDLKSEEEVLQDEVESWLLLNFPQYQWYLLHKNSPNLRSVKWIEHYHLFIKL